jgi:hypothetical protein
VPIGHAVCVALDEADGQKKPAVHASVEGALKAAAPQ